MALSITRRLILTATLALAVLAITPLLGNAGGVAHAAGNASAAAGFIEGAQNSDGGFGVKPGQASDPTATLWASVALIAAGKNPRDEFLKNGRSADDYLAAHSGSMNSLEQLGLLAMVQYGGQFGAGRYGDPAAEISSLLSGQGVGRDPYGSSIAALGLLAAGTSEGRQLADATAQALLETRTSDAAWGPSGNADSGSTALALQLLAATGAAGPGDRAVQGGIDYLNAAQANDGAIAASTRVASAGGGGSVPATAFAVQAFAALKLKPPQTSTGKTVRYGLTQYQQRTSGGLTSAGSIYSPVVPSVAETAQAFAAFNGDTYPLRSVPSVTGGPEAEKKGTEASKEAGEGKDTASTRVSSGSSSEGVSGGSDNEAADPGAFQQALAGSAGDTAGKDASSKKDHPGKPEKEEKKGKGSESGGGSEVSGTVVGAESAPALKTKAGALDDGLSNQQRAMITLVALLIALGGAGIFLERKRPRPADAPPLPFAIATAVAVALRPVGAALWRAGGFTAHDAATGALLTVRRRWALIAVGVVGIGLIVFPFATGMFEKAPKGAAMVEAFHPYMEEETLDGYQRDFGDVQAYAHEALTASPEALLPNVENAEQRRAEFLEKSPQVALFTQLYPEVDSRVGGMLDTMQANRSNYDAVAALPSFRLFPWFFVIPGVLLIGLAIGGLVFARRRPRSWIPIRRAAIAIGIGLILAPVVFQMFQRGPKGAAMVDAFKTVETTKVVQAVQGDFGTIAVGQGSITAELFPALEAKGMSTKEIEKALPAATTLRDRWTKILNNLTPMIGVMSDNVPNYQAVAALPPFGIFSWLFVFAGLAALLFALLAGRIPSRRRRSAVAVPQPAPPPAAPTEGVGFAAAVETSPPLTATKH